MGPVHDVLLALFFSLPPLARTHDVSIPRRFGQTQPRWELQ